MNWNKLTDIDQLNEIKDLSSESTVIIFKHSTRCSISSSALNRIERSWNEVEMKQVKPYYLDLLSYREVSDRIAEEFDIEHASPQLLVIKNGECVYTTSHSGINYNELVAKI
jgi:bacillithiol system protein YtxJ